MTGFRLTEDERRYNALRIEVYLRLAQHLPPLVVSEVLRNLGKMEMLMFGEGLRQGLAVARLTIADHVEPTAGMGVPNTLSMTPPEALAAIYGDAQTPLARVEAEFIANADEVRRTEQLRGSAWLSSVPARFAPQTLAEAAAENHGELDVLPARAGARPLPRPAVADPLVDPLGEAIDDVGLRERMDEIDSEVERPDDEVDLAMQSQLDELIATERARAIASGDPEPPPESPALIDRLRDALMERVRGGWTPKNWTELVMGLHLGLQMEASVIDLALASDMGRAVLAQAGLFNIFPGTGVMVDGDGAFAGTRE